VLEERTRSRCLGVFPYAADVRLDPEDSLALRTDGRVPAPRGARTAVIRLPLISNATDFSLLAWAEWIAAPSAQAFDFIILPGSKNTLSDLVWLRETGLADWIVERHARGTTVIGICGGYQMLGRTIADPGCVESSAGRGDGLGLIPAITELTGQKTTREVRATTTGGVAFAAYEIHLGVTTVAPDAGLGPFARLQDGTPEGIRGERVFGTYLHGALENASVCAEVFGVEMPSDTPKASQYQLMADWFEQHVRHVADLKEAVFGGPDASRA
jgi:adenosylcobyric acid synthase